MTLDSALNQLDLAKQLLIISAAGAVLWYVYKGAKVATDALDNVTTSAADAWVDFNNPLVNAVLRIKPQYFINGALTDEAFDVISQRYPDVYRVAFEDRKIRPDWAYLMDGQPVTNEEFQNIGGR